MVSPVPDSYRIEERNLMSGLSGSILSAMSYRFGFMLACGMVVFTVGGLARTYMNIVISRSSVSGNWRSRSTELRYRQLIREQGVPSWPLIVTVVLVPLGIITAFAAIVLSNHFD